MKSAPTSELLDLQRLTTWLDEHGLGEGDVVAEPITVGASNLIFDLRRGDPAMGASAAASGAGVADGPRHGP
jgi:hypothetical protein